MEERVLILTGCRDCPFFEGRPNHNSDDTFYAYCTHPLVDANNEVKIRSNGILFNCPLPTKTQIINEYLENEDY